MSAAHTLTSGLDAVIAVFKPFKSLDRRAKLELGGDDVRRLVIALELLRKQAGLAERELAIHRRDEENRTFAAEMEAVVTATVGKFVLPSDDNVVPFTGKRSPHPRGEPQ